MSHTVEFRLLSWDELRQFLFAQSLVVNHDVDHDVRQISHLMFAEQTVEGFFLNDVLCGFARWDRRNGHLSNLYVAPAGRGHGLSTRFLQQRPIRSLYVIPHNDGAKRLYQRMGFQLRPCAVPTREFMERVLAPANYQAA